MHLSQRWKWKSLKNKRKVLKDPLLYKFLIFYQFSLNSSIIISFGVFNVVDSLKLFTVLPFKSEIIVLDTPEQILPIKPKYHK